MARNTVADIAPATAARPRQLGKGAGSADARIPHAVDDGSLVVLKTRLHPETL